MLFLNFAEAQPHVQPIEKKVESIEQPAPQATAPEEWLSPKAVAARASIHPQTVRRYMQDGIVPYRQAAKGKAIRIEWNAFLAVTAITPNTSK